MFVLHETKNKTKFIFEKKKNQIQIQILASFLVKSRSQYPQEVYKYMAELSPNSKVFTDFQNVTRGCVSVKVFQRFFVTFCINEIIFGNFGLTSPTPIDQFSGTVIGSKINPVEISK